MDQDDPEKRVAELERQLAEQKRVAELERQLAEAKAVGQGQQNPAPVQSQWPTPGMPPPPAPPPQTGPPIGWKGAWVSVDGGGFQQLGTPGTAGPLPPHTMEKVAEALGQVPSIRGQPGFPGQGGFGGQFRSPGQGGFGPPPAVSGRGFTIGRFGRFLTIIVLLVVLIPSFVGGSFLSAVAPSSTMWMTRIVCSSPYRLSYSSRYSYGGNGRSSGASSSYECVSGTHTYPVNEFAVIALQGWLIWLVLCGAVALVALIWRLRRRSSPGIFLPVFVIAVAGCLVFAVTATVENQPTGPRQLHSADGLSALLATMRDRFGDTMGYSLSVYPDYAVLYRAHPQYDQDEQAYYYSGGNWSEYGSTTSNDGESPADLSKFDVAAVTARLPGARQALNMNADATTTYLEVLRADGGNLTLQINVSDGDSRSLQLNPDGSVK
jgi:hypothetical protein